MYVIRNFRNILYLVDLIKKICYFISRVRKLYIKGVRYMLNEKICKLRDELNKKIEENADYEIIYNLSLELDKLIAEYYKNIAQSIKKQQYKIKIL